MLGTLASCSGGELPLGSVTPETFHYVTGLKLSNIDRSVRPQDDLYGYANGLWLKTFELPSDRPSYGVFNHLSEDMAEDVADLMHVILSRDPHELTTERRKVRDFYQSFMDTARIEDLGLRPLRGLLDEIDAIGNPQQLAAIFGRFSRLGILNPVLAEVEERPDDPGRFVFHLEQSGLAMPGLAYYSGDDPESAAIRAAYKNYLVEIFTLAGSQDPVGEAASVYRLEELLAARFWTLAETRDRSRVLNIYAIAELKALTPGFDWDAFFDGLGFDPGPDAVVRQPEYFEGLAEILKSTGVAAWQSYLKFQLINDMAPFLGQDFEDARFAFYGGAVRGIDTPTPRDRDAFNLTTRFFESVFGRYYMEEKFDPAIIPAVRAMTENLRSAFIARIKANVWMSPETKAAAIRKAETLGFRIGYPGRWRDYGDLEIDPGDLAGNVLRVRAFDFANEAGKIGAASYDGAWDASALSANAYYDAAKNEIFLPAGIMRDPLFDLRFDGAENYGALGAIIGHEIVHAFDDQGRKMGPEGHLENWWTPEDEKDFDAAAARLAAFAGGYRPLPGLAMNGRQTLGENIGDLEGLALAFDAYEASLGKRESPRIVGYSGEQRLFLAWAQMWGEKMSDEELRRQLLTSLHAPGRYRANEVVVHIDGFYEAFGVKPGDALYLPPEKRIRIW